MDFKFTSQEASATWFALKYMLETYQKGLATRYDGDPRFGQEDVDFLTLEISRVAAIAAAMIRAGYKEG